MKTGKILDLMPTTLSFVAIGVVWGSFAAQVPVLKAQIAASDSQFGMAMLVSAMGAVVAMWSAPVVGKLLRGEGLRVLAVLMGVAVLMPGFAPTLVSFAAAMLVLAAITGTLDVIMNARVSEYEAETRRSYMNFHHGMFSLAYAISAFGTGLARDVGFSPWQIFAIACVVILGMSLAMRMPVPPPASEGAEAQSGQIGGLVLLAGGIILIGFMAEQATEAWSALHLERGLGADAVGGALGPTLLGLTMAIGRFGGQWIVRHAGALKVTVIAALVSALGAFLAAAASSLAMAYLGFIVLGLGVSVVAPMCFALIGQAVPDRRRAHAIARAAATGYVGFFIGPPIMGFLSEWRGLDASFAFIGVTLLAVPVLAAGLARKIRD